MKPSHSIVQAWVKLFDRGNPDPGEFRALAAKVSLLEDAVELASRAPCENADDPEFLPCINCVTCNARRVRDEVLRPPAKAKLIPCAMKRDCEAPVAMLDEKGFVYCAAHGLKRRAGGTLCRKLRPAELGRLGRGETLNGYHPAPPTAESDPCESHPEDGFHERMNDEDRCVYCGARLLTRGSAPTKGER